MINRSGTWYGFIKHYFSIKIVKTISIRFLFRKRKPTFEALAIISFSQLLRYILALTKTEGRNEIAEIIDRHQKHLA